MDTFYVWKNVTLDEYVDDVQTSPIPVADIVSAHGGVEGDYTLETKTLSEVEVIFPPDLEEYREDAIAANNLVLVEFIQAHYDEGTQNSFNAQFAEYVDYQVNGITLTEQQLQVKNALLLVKSWISTVMSYYYSVKDEYINAASVSVIDAVSGEYETRYGDTGVVFPDPGITLASFYGY
ncbi:MAG: hypothetical protein GY861_22740 [bacterium]|nr:hypothetical protein [bacterium]